MGQTCCGHFLEWVATQTSTLFRMSTLQGVGTRHRRVGNDETLHPSLKDNFSNVFFVLLTEVWGDFEQDGWMTGGAGVTTSSFVSGLHHTLNQMLKV